MEWKYADLVSISMELNNVKNFPPLEKPNLKKVKEFYFRAKEIFLSIEQPNDYEIKEIIEIFTKSCEKISVFFIKWREGKIEPTDEELDLLEESCSEACDNFNILTEKFPNTFSAEDNKKQQGEIAKGKEFVLEEKRKRTSKGEDEVEKKTKELQSQIDSLKSQPNNNNSDNEDKIKDLQRQIDELKRSKPNLPKVPQQPISSSLKNDDNRLVGFFCLGLGVCLILGVGYLVLQNKKKKKKKQGREPLERFPY